MSTHSTRPPHGLRFSGTTFWVRHRRREYGPFDYEWSQDFNGIELTYRSRKFGEYCSSDEIFADLKEFKLPMRVIEVGSVVIGCVVYGVLNGFSRDEFDRFVVQRLRAMGFEKFTSIHRDVEPG